MNYLRKITDDLYWVGGSDRRLALFENVYPVPRGVSYNSYLILDEKTAVLDTADAAISRQFRGERAPHPGRPSSGLPGGTTHGARPLQRRVERCCCDYPEMKIVCTAKTVTLINQFYDLETLAGARHHRQGGGYPVHRAATPPPSTSPPWSIGPR